MRWEQKYPEAQVDQDQVQYGVYRSGVIGTCFVCGKRTSWVDISFDAHLCSEECEQASLDDIATRTQDAAKQQQPSF